MPVRKIISGGQSGVDRAALDVALDRGICCGGWCPCDRIAEDGRIDGRYPLAETQETDPDVRTRLNVRDADGTLIIARPPLAGGTELTRRLAEEMGRPCLVVDPASPGAPGEIARWLGRHRPGVLNVAGPRESQSAGIYEEARKLLAAIFS